MANEVHDLSEVLTGAMFDVLIELGELYDERCGGRERADAAADGRPMTGQARRSKKKSPLQAFWNAADRMQRMAIQPLDLLPPVEVTFRDYALAVCRSQRLADPLDPQDYYGMLIKVFRKREILSAEDVKELKEPRYLNDRLDLTVRHTSTASRDRAPPPIGSSTTTARTC